MTEYTDIDYAQARKIVTDAKANDKAIRLDRIGATPWVKYTPYENNEGVTINMWSCISHQLHARPERTLLGFPTVIKPWEEDTWEVNHLSTPWVVKQVIHSRIVKVVPKAESPFTGDIVGAWYDD
jgi:hypothetical protein